MTAHAETSRTGPTYFQAQVSPSIPLPLKHLEFWNRAPALLLPNPPHLSQSLPIVQCPFSLSITLANSTSKSHLGPTSPAEVLDAGNPWDTLHPWPGDITHCSVSTCPHSLPQLWEVTALSLSVVYPEHNAWFIFIKEMHR